MDKNTAIENLKKALKREKLARKEAERILEQKSIERYNANQNLTEALSSTNRFPEENPSPVLRFSARGHVLMYSNMAGNVIVDFLDDEPNSEVNLFFLKQLEFSFSKDVHHQFEIVVADSTFLINAVPFRSTNYINLYGTDITAIKRANEAIKQSEEKYRGIIESLKLGILEVDTNDKIIRAYPQFCSLIGYDEEELLGESPTELFLDESSKEMMRLANNKRRDGHSSVYEISLIKKNGDIIWVIISGAPFYGSDGAVKGSIGVHLDITDRRKMESELRASKLRAEDLNKAEEMFLASMSHEIRTPMNAIIGLSELLKQTNLENSQLNHLSAIQSSSKNLLVLINDLLDFSKIESGKLTLESVSFDLRKLVLTAAETVSVKADENGVSIVTKIDKTLPKYLKGDPTRIRQVILNLLINAVKFSSNALVRMRVDSIKSNRGN